MKIRLLLWITLFCFVFWLFWMGVVPSGHIVYVKDFSKDYDEHIQRLTPAERVEPIQNGLQKIIGDPVYFALRIPRRFEKAKMTVRYRNKSELPIIEAGVLTDKILWQYDLKPIENQIIDKLALVWDGIEGDGVILLQKEKKYNSIEEFLDNLPERDEVALYNIEVEKEFTLLDYSSEFNPGNPELSSVELRGPYQFYTYIKNEELDFEFNILDLNKNKDSDPVDLNLYYDNELIAAQHLDDDGISMDSREISEERTLSLKAPNLPEGVYKIEFKANDDIITQSIKTSQQKISFINKLWIYNSQGEGLALYTDSNIIHAQTTNPDRLQTLKISENDLEISETFKLFSLNLEPGIKKIEISKDDIIVSGNRVFSFRESQLIDPQFKKVDNNIDIAGEGVNYILVRYKSPEERGEWKEAEVEFDLTYAYREFYKHSILISVPGLRAEDPIEDYVEINEIKFELMGKSLWEKILEKLKIKN